ncbi:MAG: ABC transporter permease [Halieaceae bacterium]|nr:ABC transporter permease [Halieaceae bacterium]
MIERLLAAIHKEAQLFLRDPKSRAMLFGLPVMQVLIFGLAATLDVNNVELAIVNDDAGRWSREMIQRVESAGFVANTTHLDNTAELKSMIETRQVLLGLHFPADFSRKVSAGTPAGVRVVIDGRRANAGQVVSSYLGAMVAELGAELEQDRGVPPIPEAVSRNWFNANLDYRWFMVPNLSATMSMIIALMITALSIPGSGSWAPLTSCWCRQVPHWKSSSARPFPRWSRGAL